MAAHRAPPPLALAGAGRPSKVPPHRPCTGNGCRDHSRPRSLLPAGSPRRPTRRRGRHRLTAVGAGSLRMARRHTPHHGSAIRLRAVDGCASMLGRTAAVGAARPPPPTPPDPGPAGWRTRMSDVHRRSIASDRHGHSEARTPTAVRPQAPARRGARARLIHEDGRRRPARRKEHRRTGRLVNRPSAHRLPDRRAGRTGGGTWWLVRRRASSDTGCFPVPTPRQETPALERHGGGHLHTRAARPPDPRTAPET